MHDIRLLGKESPLWTYMQFMYIEIHDTNFALMPEMLKLELLIKTLSSSGTCFSLLKLTVTSLSAVLKAIKYPGLPLLILQNKYVTIWTESLHICMCNSYTTILMATSYHVDQIVHGSLRNLCNEIHLLFRPKTEARDEKLITFLKCSGSVI
jgi:hypothetical protein